MTKDLPKAGKRAKTHLVQNVQLNHSNSNDTDRKRFLACAFQQAISCGNRWKAHFMQKKQVLLLEKYLRQNNTVMVKRVIFNF